LEKLIAIVQNLLNITYLAEALPFFLCLIFYKKIISRELKVFFIYTISFVLFLSLRLFFRYYLDSPLVQLFIVRISIIVEFIFLSLFYFYNLKYKRKKIFLISSLSIFIVYSFYDYYTYPTEFSYIPLVIQCLFFLLVIPYYFYEQMQFSIASPIYQLPSFWISVAFLIYFSGNFFLFLYSKTMFKDTESKIQYNMIYCCFTIIKDMLLCTAIFINNHKDKEALHSNIPISFDLDSFKPIKNNY
jgi:hypothetical protein